MECCAEWADATAGKYPQIERDCDGEWSINGCCGGGCYVIENVRFCPFCGAAKARQALATFKENGSE